MGHYRPRSRRRDCERKVPHRTRSGAQRHLDDLIAKDGTVKDPERLEVYECPHCGFLHIGHVPKSDRRKYRRPRRYWRDCTEEDVPRYETHPEAWAVALSAYRLGELLTCFACPSCGGWHTAEPWGALNRKNAAERMAKAERRQERLRRLAPGRGTAPIQGRRGA